jgi:Zn-dependent protease with chaperone function
MFAARGITISLSVFFLVYSACSIAVYCSWQRAGFCLQKYPARRRADLMFALRMFPLAASVAITLALALPSFLLLEPRAIVEPLGGAPLVLGLCGLSLLIFGAMNAARALIKTSRTIQSWVSQAVPVRSSVSVPVWRTSRAVPALTAAGVLRPRVLMSGAAEFILTPKELQTALQHELAHVRRRDNLKKLLLRFVPFPGMAGLETAWLESTEMAADDAAVSSVGEALDLAAALIKLSRLRTSERPAELTAALMHSPAGLMNARVERLIAWDERRKAQVPRYSPWYGLTAGLTMVAGFAVAYGHLLVRVHMATEWLVR